MFSNILKQHKLKSITIILIISMVMVCASTLCGGMLASADEVGATPTPSVSATSGPEENLRDAVYNIKYTSPLEEDVGEEYVDPLTGDLTVTRTDLSLPGMNGLDLEFKRFHTTTNAYLGQINLKNPTFIYEYMFCCTNEECPEHKDGRVVINEGQSGEKTFGFENYNYIQVGTGNTIFQWRMVHYLTQTEANSILASCESSEGHSVSVDIGFHRSGVDQKFPWVEDNAPRIFGIDYSNEEVPSENVPYNMGANWAYDFPYVEKVVSNNNDIVAMYLHLGSKGVWKIDTNNINNANNANNANNGLLGYNGQDVKFIHYDTNNMNNKDTPYEYHEKTGISYYFNKDGLVKEIKNQYGNTITFTYEDKRIKTVTDTCGRVVTLNKLSGTALRGYDKAEQLIITDPNANTASEEEITSKEVNYYYEKVKSITGIYVYELKASYGTVFEDYTYSYIPRRYSHTRKSLSNFMFDIGGLTGDEENDVRIAKSEYFSGSSVLTSLYLTSINIDGSGYRNYEYAYGCKKKLGNTGTIEFAKVNRIFNTDGDPMGLTDANGNKLDVLNTTTGKYDGIPTDKVLNEIKYTYSTEDGYEYDGFKVSGNHSNPTELITTTTEENAGKTSKTMKNGLGYLVKTVENGSDSEETVTTEYTNNDKGLPTKIKTITQDKDENGALREIYSLYENYEYNVYGDVLTYYKSSAPRDGEGNINTQDADHIKYCRVSEYEYNLPGNGKGLLSKHISDVYYNDANTIIKEENEYDDNNNTLIRSTTSKKELQDDDSFVEVRKIEYGYTNDDNHQLQAEVDYVDCLDKDNNPTVTTTYGYGSNAGDKSQVVLQTVVYGGEQPKVTTTAYDYFGNVIEEGDLLGAKTTTQYNQTKSYGAEFFESESEGGIVKAQTTQAPEVIGERTIYANVDAKTSQSTTYSDNLNITSTVDRFGRQEISINAPNGNRVLSYSSDSGSLTLSKYDNNSRLIEERVYLVTGDKFFEITNDNNNELLPIMENFYNNSTIPIDGNGRKYHQYSIVENEYTEQGDLISTKEKGSGNEYIRYEEYSQLVEKTNNGNKLNTSITKVYDPTTENAITPTLMKESISKTYTDRKDRVIKSIQTVKKYNEGTVTYVTEETINTYEPISDRLESVTTKYNDGAREKTTTTSYEYDYLGNQQQIIRNDGKSNFVEYNALGNAVRSYDYVSYNGEKYFTNNTYYSNGMLKSSEIPLDGNNSQNVYYKYDAAGNVVSKEVSIGVSGKSEKTEYAYDANGRMIQVTNYLKHKTGVTNEEKQITQYLYDQDGNEIRRYTGLTEPLYMELEVYNQNDNNEDGNEHETYVDASGNTKILYGADKERFTRGGVTYQIRVGFFNSRHVQDYRVAKYEYDLENKLKSYTDPDGRVETYSYDFKGNLVKTVDKEGNITKNTYDAKQRITETKVEDAEEKDADIVTSYTYNVLDELEQVNDKTFTYDVMSRVITETDIGLLPTKQIKKEYEYSVDGLLETKKILVGNAVKLHQTYSYDVLDRLSQVYEVEGEEKNLVVSYGYDLNGNRTSEEVGPKTVNYEYNRNNQVTNVSNKYSNAVVSNYSYTYDRYGRQSGKTDTVYENNVGNSSTTAYGYDLLGRIISESGNGNSSLVYEYDENNNRSKLTSTQNGIASVTTYQYNKNDELTNESVVVGENTAKNITDYWYDLNGNQIAKTNAIIDSNVAAQVEPSAPVATDAPETTPMPENNGEDIGISVCNVSDITDGEKPELSEYDALNRLVKVKIGNKVYKYGYDENGLRTWKEVNGVKTYFVWDDDQIVLEINENERVKKYVRGLSLIYSEDDDSTTNDRVYYNYNAHGDVVQLLDEAGTVTKYYQYDSFGNEINEDENDENPWRYCGESGYYWDAETKTHYCQNRYFDSSIGRFTQLDPAEDGTNYYVYCYNSPVEYIDPNGLWGAKIHRTATKVIAKKLGFNEKKAQIIAEVNAFADNKDLRGAKKQATLKDKNGKLIKLNGKKIIVNTPKGNQYVQYGNEKIKTNLWNRNFSADDTSLHWSDKSERFYNKYIKYKKKYGEELSLFFLAWGLHSKQDSYSHKGIIHYDLSDNIDYDYQRKKNGKFIIGQFVKKKKDNNIRVKNTLNASIEYLRKAASKNVTSAKKDEIRKSVYKGIY